MPRIRPEHVKQGQHLHRNPAKLFTREPATEGRSPWEQELHDQLRADMEDDARADDQEDE